jgi:hypothetical protein
MAWQCICLDTFYYGNYCEFETTTLKVRNVINKSCAYIAITVLVVTISFFVIMDILKYVFGIDPVAPERERLRRQKLEKQRAAQLNASQPKVALRFQYVA